jgi:hypothetical protein
VKFKHINISALRDLVPVWAYDYMALGRTLDRYLDEYPLFKASDPERQLPFWIEVKINEGDQDDSIRIAEPETGCIEEQLSHGRLTIEHKHWKIRFAINDILKATLPRGRYCVYTHAILTDVPLAYIGISSRPWFVRYAEHETAARTGSRFLFHDALRSHVGKNRTHQIILFGVDLGNAMRAEEELVAIGTLYPLGLNMIPGGYAGLKYLSTLSLRVKDSEYAPEHIEEAMQRESLAGRPNPLLAARWESDPDYVERVICGHSGRLTVDQVRMIRMMHVACRAPDEIAVLANANALQVKRLLSNQTYGRVR